MATTEWVNTYFVKLSGATMDPGATIRVDTDPGNANDLTRASYVDGADASNRRFTFYLG